MDYGSSGVNKNWPIPPVTTSFFLRQFLGEKHRQRKGGTGKKAKEEQKEKHREREREKESEEEKEESGGGTQRGKWCSKKPASTLDWNLKVPGSIPGSTLREIIHPKSTQMNYLLLLLLLLLLWWYLAFYSGMTPSYGSEFCSSYTTFYFSWNCLGIFLLHALFHYTWNTKLRYSFLKMNLLIL